MDKNTLSLVSLNIEGDKHLDRVLPFLKSQNADVICLQEALDKDVEFLEKELAMNGTYFPTVKMPEGNRGGITPGTQWGVLVLYRQEALTVQGTYYVQHSEQLPVFDNSDVNSTNRVLVKVEYEKDGVEYKISTTHFTWTDNGESNELQLENLRKMFETLDSYDEFVLCGDFNAPRGKATWEILAKKYTDNIPAEIETTIDQNLHKVKGLQFVVDGMFSTPQYSVTNVQVIDGVSDHMAISAKVQRVS